MTLPKSVKADSMSCFSSGGAVLNEAALMASKLMLNNICSMLMPGVNHSTTANNGSRLLI